MLLPLLIRLLPFISLLISFPGFSQFSKLYSVSAEYSWFNCDQNKNVYFLDEDKFIKLSPPYTTMISYELGIKEKPFSIDINNPDQIVLFFQNSNKIILLDSSLMELTSPIYLDELGMQGISIVFSEKDKSLWFYIFTDNNLTKLNTDFMPLVRNLNLNPYFEFPNNPNYIVTFENKIYLNIPNYGILVLGQRGEFITAYQLPGLFDFQIDSKALYFYRDNIIYCYNYRNLKIKKIYIPQEKEVLNAWFFYDQIIIQLKNGFEVLCHEINPIENN